MVAGQLSGRMLAQRLRRLQFKPLPRHSVVEVSSSLTPTQFLLNVTEDVKSGVKSKAEMTKPSFLQALSNCLTISVYTINIFAAHLLLTYGHSYRFYIFNSSSDLVIKGEFPKNQNTNNCFQSWYLYNLWNAIPHVKSKAEIFQTILSTV